MNVEGVVPEIGHDPISELLNIRHIKGILKIDGHGLSSSPQYVAQLGTEIQTPESIFRRGGIPKSNFEGHFNQMGLYLIAFYPEIATQQLITETFWQFYNLQVGIIGIYGITQAQAQANISFLVQGEVFDKTELQAIGKILLVHRLGFVHYVILGKTYVELILQIVQIRRLQ